MIQHNNDKVVAADLDALKLLMLDTIYPIGSIYMSVNNVSPSTLFGGTWEAIQDRFLLAAGSTYTAGDTGGAVNHTPSGNLSSTSITPAGTLSGGAVGNHTLTKAETPAHSHDIYIDIDYNSNAHKGGAKSYCAIKTSSWYGWESNQPSLYFTTDYPFGPTNSVGGGGAHNHPFTQPTFTGTASSHGHTFTGTSQNTMPPYLTVYIWKRVS